MMNKPGYHTRIAAATNSGMMRKNNEDAYLIGSDFILKDCTMYPVPFRSPDGVVAAVADGMGGSVYGEIASSLAMSSVKEFFMNLPPVAHMDNDKVESVLNSCLADAAFTLRSHARFHPETAGMGTTVVLAWLLGNMAYIIWCGDSRAYLFRKGEGLSMLTSDHNLLQELLEEDSVSLSEAHGHPASHILTRFIGDTAMDPQPDFIAVPLEVGDIILLCSDGLNGMLPDSQIENIISVNPDIEVCKNELIKAANQAGGYDNITVVLAEIFVLS